jgi:hypothetical protein
MGTKTGRIIPVIISSLYILSPKLFPGQNNLSAIDAAISLLCKKPGHG